MDRAERCEKKFAELFGGKPTMNEGSDPEFMRILQRFIFGEVSYTGSLDDKMRELITVTVLVVNQTLPQLKAHVGASLNVGCTPEEIREAVYQCAPFVGFPKILNAIAAMNEVFSERGITLPLPAAETVTEEDRFEREAPLRRRDKREIRLAPRGICRGGAALFDRTMFFRLYDAQGFGRQDARTSDRRHSCGDGRGGGSGQVRSHVEGAIKAGNTAEEIVCALAHAMPYMGVPRLFNALNRAKEILDRRRQ